MNIINLRKRKRSLCISKRIWILCSLLLSSTAYSISTFNEEYVSLVAYNGNFLFRGSIPRDDQNTFQRQQLIDILQRKAQYYGLSLPNDYQLSIVSLLTNEREDEATFLENLGFSMKRQRSQMIDDIFWTWWQVRAHYAEKVGAIPLFDQVFDNEYLCYPRLITFVSRLFEKKNDKPTILYIHCRHGRNRTTAAIAGFLMKTFNLPVSEVWDEVYVRKIFEPEQLYIFLTQYEKYLQLLPKRSERKIHQKIVLPYLFQETIE